MLGWILGGQVSFFSDTYEIDHVIDLLADSANADAVEELSQLIDGVVLMLLRHVKSFGLEEDYELLKSCLEYSDITHSYDFFRYEDTKVAADALGSLLFLKESMDSWEQGELHDLLQSVLKDLKIQLKMVLLYHFQAASVSGAISASKTKRPKKCPAIYYVAYNIVRKANGTITVNEVWQSIENNEVRIISNDTEEEVIVYVEDGNIYQSSSAEDGDGSTRHISKAAFRRYVSDSIDEFLKIKEKLQKKLRR